MKIITQNGMRQNSQVMSYSSETVASHVFTVNFVGKTGHQLINFSLNLNAGKTLLLLSHRYYKGGIKKSTELKSHR